MYKIRVYGDSEVLSAIPQTIARHCGSEEDPDAALVMPGRSADEPLKAPVVIAPSDCRAITGQFISYGSNPKDTVTFSSVSGDHQMLSLQREIVTLDGVRLEQQDIPLPQNNKPHKTLALCALMLTIGVDPSGLADMVRNSVK